MRRLALPAALLALLGGAGTAAAVTDPGPIGPNQRFSGIVNGKTANAPILNDCVGPIVPGQTGHPQSGQYVLATTLPATTTGDVGYTGSAANSVTAVLQGGSMVGPAATVIGTLKWYEVKVPIPTALTVPCAGAGEVDFIPTPTSSTAHTAVVTVSFIGQP
jgi:hypothetical protein